MFLGAQSVDVPRGYSLEDRMLLREVREDNHYVAKTTGRPQLNGEGVDANVQE